MRLLIFAMIACYLGATSVLAYRVRDTQKQLDSFQADLNLLNADMQALDYLRRPAPLDAEPMRKRTEYFI